MAEAIAEDLNADIEEIKDKKNRMGATGFLRSGYEAIFRKLTDIYPTGRNPEEYDMVVVGSPVWVGSLSSPIRTYMALNGHKIKKIAFFSTYGIISGKIFRQMEELSKQPIATLNVKEKEVKSGEYLKKVKEFTKTLKIQLKK
nr:hypothetical protein [Candidatus Freyrarchaeum guaymaensis]